MAQPRTRVADESIERFCSGCHVLPRADSFARASWREEVTYAFGFHLESHRLDLIPPPREATIAYFESRAPEQLRLDPARNLADRDVGGQPIFRPRVVTTPDASSPAVARIEPAANTGGWWVTDMRGGAVWEWSGADDAPRAITGVSHPASVVPLNVSDGPSGRLLGDLGSFLPEDHSRGQVWWLADGTDVPVPLITGLGRVAHLATGDLDGDGSADLVVSEFGWRKTGRLRAYWGAGHQDGRPVWSESLIDPRHGAVRAEIVDLDRDGRLEVVAAFAQEHETLDIYRPTDRRGFRRETVDQGRDPSVGTSQFLVVDLDLDGLQDIILCHGDSFDGGPLRPQHGLSWFRQTSMGSWEQIDLGGMPGVHGVAAGDLDGDGDVDLAATALLPRKILESPDNPRLAAVLWLEQTVDSRFIPHVLEWQTCRHAAIHIADTDTDGDLDLLIGNYAWDASSDELLTVWVNTKTP